MQRREVAHHLTQHIEIDLQASLAEERKQQFEFQIARTATHSEHRCIDPLRTAINRCERIDQSQFEVIMSVETNRHRGSFAHHCKRSAHIVGRNPTKRIDHIDTIDPTVELRQQFQKLGHLAPLRHIHHIESHRNTALLNRTTEFDRTSHIGRRNRHTDHIDKVGHGVEHRRQIADADILLVEHHRHLLLRSLAHALQLETWRVTETTHIALRRQRTIAHLDHIDRQTIHRRKVAIHRARIEIPIVVIAAIT